MRWPSTSGRKGKDRIKWKIGNRPARNYATTRAKCDFLCAPRTARGRPAMNVKSTCEERLYPLEALTFRGGIYRCGAHRKSLECSSAMDFLSASLRCYRDTWSYFCSCAAPAAERCSHCAALSRDSRGFSPPPSRPSLYILE